MFLLRYRRSIGKFNYLMERGAVGVFDKSEEGSRRSPAKMQRVKEEKGFFDGEGRR